MQGSPGLTLQSIKRVQESPMRALRMRETTHGACRLWRADKKIPFYFFKFMYFHLMYMSVLHPCIYVHYMYAVPTAASMDPLELEPLCGFWEPIPGPLQE